jgi:hypothetical protein
LGNKNVGHAAHRNFAYLSKAHRFKHSVVCEPGMRLMIGAEWKDVGDLVIKLVGREPPFVQILYVLGVAFSAVMFLEGVRANFLPARKHSARRTESPRIDVQLQEASAMAFAETGTVMAELPNQNRPRALHSVKSNNPRPATSTRQAARPKNRRV